jgi:hypothetical protein
MGKRIAPVQPDRNEDFDRRRSSLVVPPLIRIAGFCRPAFWNQARAHFFNF